MEGTVKNTTNAVDTMLCLQKADSTQGKRTANLHLAWSNIENTELGAQYDQDQEEHALGTISRCVNIFGNTATQEIEEQLEFLQEEFLAHLEMLLKKHGINIQEKLTISLTADNKLILQCQEEEELLLTALGDDTKLVKHLQTMQKAALVSRGLDYILAVQNKENLDNLPQYRVCTKGALSHFYLKN